MNHVNNLDIDIDGVPVTTEWMTHSTFFNQSNWSDHQITEDMLMRMRTINKKKKNKNNTSTLKRNILPGTRNKVNIPSDRDVQEAINFSIMSSDYKYISFTRYEDEPIVDYMRYAGLIRPTEAEFSYDQKFEIDQAVWIHYIKKYKTLGKKIEMILRENPMIWAGIVSFTAVICSGTVLWFITRFLDKFINL